MKVKPKKVEEEVKKEKTERESHGCENCGKEFNAYNDRLYCFDCSEDGVDLYEDCIKEKKEGMNG